MGLERSTHGDFRNICIIFVGKPERRNHLEDLGVDDIRGKTIKIDFK
jgi:hypothetical protein